MKYGVFIGPTKETVETAREALLLILESRAGDPVKIEAIRALTLLCRVGNTDLSNSTITDSAAYYGTDNEEDEGDDE